MKQALAYAGRRSIPLLWLAVLAPSFIIVDEQIARAVRGWEHPVSEWFEPYAIEVPTPQVIDSNLYLFYGRRVWKPFDGTYRVSVVPVGSNAAPRCDDDFDTSDRDEGLPHHQARTELLPPAPMGSKSHAEDHDYLPKTNTVPLVVVGLNDFIGTNWCAWLPGFYQIEASWVVRRKGYNDEIVGPLLSNVFELRAPEAPNPR